MRDYGEKINLQLYGSNIPPDYNMIAVTVPVALYFAEDDAFLTDKVSKGDH